MIALFLPPDLLRNPILHVGRKDISPLSSLTGARASVSSRLRVSKAETPQ